MHLLGRLDKDTQKCFRSYFSNSLIGVWNLHFLSITYFAWANVIICVYPDLKLHVLNQEDKIPT